MELQAIVVVCGLGVVGAAVVLLMKLFSTAGTSFEESLAEQKKVAYALRSLVDNKNKPKKNLKKVNKKLAKKDKNKDVQAAAPSGSEPESEQPADSGADEEVQTKPHVDFRPPVVVDVPYDSLPNVKIRKRGKDHKIKPILLNKEDPSCSLDPSNPPTPCESNVSNHFEEIHPKDEFELMTSQTLEKTEKKEEVVTKKEAKPVKQAKSKASAKPAASESVKEEPAIVEQPKEQRKAKRSDKRDEVDSVPPLNVPQPSELTTDKLLQAAAPAVSTPPPRTKKKKQEPNVLALMAGDTGGVNVTELVRVVREAALSRTEIQILTDALLNKHHDPLPQHSDWREGPNDPMVKLKKQLAEKEKALADEVDASHALHAKLKELRASLNSERSRATALTRTVEEVTAEMQATAQRANRLNEEKMMLQTKLNAEVEAQAQRVQMEMHIQRLQEAESSLVGQVSALQTELSARALETGAARCEAAAARDAALLAQQHAADLAQQLQETNRVCAEIDAQRQNVLIAEQAAREELRRAQEAISEMQAEVQRASARAQLAESNFEKNTEDAENQRQQLLSEVKSLEEQLAAKEAELAEVKCMKVAAPSQNGLAPSDSTENKGADLAKVEAVVQALRAELEAAQKSSREQREQVAALSEQLQQYQTKNNDLRTKNWKVMEALQSAEKALQTKSSSALPAQDPREAIEKALSAQYSEIASVLSAACPAAAPGGTAGRDWLKQFAAALPRVTAAPAPAPTSELDVTQLRAENLQLQGLVDKYKKIIDDTESGLSRLQQNVTSEEQRWAKQLADTQRELEELRTRTVTQMQKKIDTLEAELQKQRTNHNHSFTDMEKNSEERLLSGLSDKQKLDSCNGPSQINLSSEK